MSGIKIFSDGETQLFLFECNKIFDSFEFLIISILRIRMNSLKHGLKGFLLSLFDLVQHDACEGFNILECIKYYSFLILIRLFFYPLFVYSFLSLG